MIQTSNARLGVVGNSPSGDRVFHICGEFAIGPNQVSYDLPHRFAAVGRVMPVARNIEHQLALLRPLRGEGKWQGLSVRRPRNKSGCERPTDARCRETNPACICRYSSRHRLSPADDPVNNTR